MLDENAKPVRDTILLRRQIKSAILNQIFCFQDALQAQMVIKKMSEMIDSKSIGNDDDTDATVINNNKAIMDHENNVTEVSHLSDY